ncbi:MAG: 4-amino-4-deoxychorismate lyase [Lachnospiraceae bacterium]|nr:4-amino-4-deoxychorismate lyase [Lachnospiraceae bacterium]
MNIQLDEGYLFGLGVFETIALTDGKPEYLDLHLERINNSLEYFNIPMRVDEGEVMDFLKNGPTSKALKIVVSEKNKVFLFRDHPYTPERLKKGFNLEYSKVVRNETSPFVYHKTLNYGDNILEKRRLFGSDVDEVIFLNTKGQICEGSTTNIFFVADSKIYTPKKESGLLPGVMRRVVMEKYDVEERDIYPEDVASMDECYVTNSLMGIMAVNKLGEKLFLSGKTIK